MKRPFLAFLAVMLLAPCAFAQTPPTPPAPQPNVQRTRPARLRLPRRVLRRGVRSGRITSDELARLRAERQAFRARLQSIRQSGRTPTPGERQEIRQARQKFRDDVLAAGRRGPAPGAR